MKTRRWTNADLMEMFLEYNSRYFGGKLRTPASLSFASLDGLGHCFRYRHLYGPHKGEEELFGIHIGKDLRDSRRQWLLTLIHEMVHLEQGNRYSCGLRGKRFNKRMRELALAGAFDGLW